MNRGSVFISLTSGGNDIMRNSYQYDAVDNILGISNNINPQSLTQQNKAKLGGSHIHSYQYDELNRLIHATGKAKSASYDMAMTFNNMSMPISKVQTVDSTTTATSYHNIYRYEDSNHPTAPTQIGHEHYEYDANGNPTLVTNDSLNTTRELYWDEDNRLMVLSDNGKTSRYTYNHAGERIVKSHGDMEGVYINGAPQGITFHETDEFTLYPASIISVNKNRFTKHYFIGDKRIASRIGSGKFNNVYGRNGSHVTAGQQDYAERMNQIESQKEDYYKELGIAPGVPTMKGAYGDPENTGIGYNTIITELGDHSVPEAWAQYAKKNDKEDTAPGAPIAWDDPISPEEPEAGYGFVADSSSEPEETFFYHSDHLGSTSYITDDKGNITQYDAYLPYGELLVDEHSSSEDLPYKFNGKELDEETGLYYYGARYLQPIASIWYGVDPLTEKYTNVSGYTYCLGNPVKLVDSDGRKVWVFAIELPGDYKGIGGKYSATHTFVVVQTSDGKVQRFEYGPKGNSFWDVVSGNSPLTQCNYTDSGKSVDTYMSTGKMDSYTKNVESVNVPKGMSSDQFDNAVIKSAADFKGNTEMKYRLIPIDATEGNCNTSTTSLLKNAGVSQGEINRIGDKIQGTKTGFGTTKAWTKKERETLMEEKVKLSESLSNQIGF